MHDVEVSYQVQQTCTGALTGAWDVIAIGTDNDNGGYGQSGQSVATQDALVLIRK